MQEDSATSDSDQWRGAQLSMQLQKKTTKPFESWKASLSLRTFFNYIWSHNCIQVHQCCPKKHDRFIADSWRHPWLSQSRKHRGLHACVYSLWVSWQKFAMKRNVTFHIHSWRQKTDFISLEFPTWFNIHWIIISSTTKKKTAPVSHKNQPEELSLQVK